MHYIPIKKIPTIQYIILLLVACITSYIFYLLDTFPMLIALLNNLFRTAVENITRIFHIVVCYYFNVTTVHFKYY